MRGIKRGRPGKDNLRSGRVRNEIKIDSIRTKKIVALALGQEQKFRDENLSDDPYSSDSYDDPCFVPQESSDSDGSDYDSYESENEVFTNKNKLSLLSLEHRRQSNKGQEKERHLRGSEYEEIRTDEVSEENQEGTVFIENNAAQIGAVENDQPEEQVLYDLAQSVWESPKGRHEQIEENYVGGIQKEWEAALMGLHPIDYYLAFVDFKIIDVIVDQTNLYATQFLLQNNSISNKARAHKWEPTNRAEILHFIGILGYMGIVRMNSLRDYWSQKWLLKSEVARSVMSRNRFEILLKMLHFSDNEKCPQGDRLYKIQPLLDLLIKNFQNLYTPEKTFCIDETMVPFQGRLLFKQYNPQKTHKYGIKLFKLCCSNGFTWNMSIYAGKEKEPDNSLAVSTQIVLNLAQKLLQKGRVCVTDNWYTSLQLAHILLDKKTHCLGTLRVNRKGNPPDVINKKLTRGEVFGQENERGICVMKWRDKRDVLILSTCHGDKMVEIQRHGKIFLKPKAIVAYNAGKSSIDISDQMSSYSSALRKSMRWYKKLAVELVLGTSMVNAHFIHKQVEQSTISINDFRLSVIEDLLKFEDKRAPAVLRQNVSGHLNLKSHKFSKLDCKARENRRYCTGCYKKKREGIIEKNKVKKVITYCQHCEGNPRYCLDCFNVFHK